MHLTNFVARPRARERNCCVERTQRIEMIMLSSLSLVLDV